MAEFVQLALEVRALRSDKCDDLPKGDDFALNSLVYGVLYDVVGFQQAFHPRESGMRPPVRSCWRHQMFRSERSILERDQGESAENRSRSLRNPAHNYRPGKPLSATFI
ncbi:hypothetical protein LB577_19385 [Mesorhizobium sp. B283B1A]|uniref:hypothetical protein n=1 Tax=Mesorhizobium TaxID=68287 RepID=UPI001CD0F600|nr:MULTISPECIES: hypothetical protein [Mesorhizobium]MCA0049085.1 hypothetical protein [Mesorhizobium sp. B283B1A]UQS62716.1 hypothetical protein M5D98_21475 [Mesorhizobium opportunistum]